MAQFELEFVTHYRPTAVHQMLPAEEDNITLEAYAGNRHLHSSVILYEPSFTRFCYVKHATHNSKLYM